MCKYDISDIKTSADGNRILYWGTVILKSDKPINDLIPITWSICDEDAASAAFPDVDPNRLRMESLGYLLERGDDGEWVAIAIDPTGGYFVGDFDISTYKK